MGRYLREENEGLVSLRSEEKTFSQLKAGGSRLAQDILALLAKEPLYSHEIAKRLGTHEQKIYYHIRKLEQAGLIMEERRAEVRGGSAKYYTLSAPSFSVLLKEGEPGTKINSVPARHKDFLQPFIKDGKQEFLIVVGSPEAHGPNMARASDGSYAIDLAMFLGSYLSERPKPAMKLDTEFHEKDWQKNLIIIGGPIVNTVATKVNEHLPISFLEDGKSIRSSVSGTTYEEGEIGFIVKAPNPLAPKKEILFLAGRRKSGTKAAILAFLKHFDELINGNRHESGIPARVVEGRDHDSDGIVDDLIFKE